MKQSEDRRSFLFGVGAFATAIFLPKAPKLIFPVADNPIALVTGPMVGSNRTGNREVYLWVVNQHGQMKFYEKWGAPPCSPFDGREVQGMANEPARRRFESGGWVMRTEADTGNAEWLQNSAIESAHMLKKESAEAFMRRAHAIEKELSQAENV